MAKCKILSVTLILAITASAAALVSSSTPRLNIKRMHKFFLMPYPIFKDSSGKSLHLIGQNSGHGRFLQPRPVIRPVPSRQNYARSVRNPLPQNQENEIIDSIEDDTEVATKVKEVMDNSKFSRGMASGSGSTSGVFKPSPKHRPKLDAFVGQWIPGRFPGEYTWNGMDDGDIDINDIGESVKAMAPSYGPPK